MMEPTDTRPAPLRESSTGLLRTTVTAGDDGTLWTHRLGEEAPFAFSPLQVRLNRPSALVVLGSGDGTRRTYRTSTTAIVPDLLSAARPEALARVGRWWGRALHTVHTHATAPASPLPPRTLTRAQAWTDGGWSGVGEVIGGDGIAAIQAWAEETLALSHPVVVHGSPGMAHWTIAPDGSEAALLTGEDVGVADASYDSAWVLGELAEIFHFYPAARPGITLLRQGFEDGYGTLPEPDALRVGIAFRLIQHAYDWHHYAGAPLDNAQLLIRLAAAYLRTPSVRTGAGFL